MAVFRSCTIQVLFYRYIITFYLIRTICLEFALGSHVSVFFSLELWKLLERMNLPLKSWTNGTKERSLFGNESWLISPISLAPTWYNTKTETNPCTSHIATKKYMKAGSIKQIQIPRQAYNITTTFSNVRRALHTCVPRPFICRGLACPRGLYCIEPLPDLTSWSTSAWS